jgi:hypothetical protein
MRIFECANGATVFTALRMSLRHAMLAGGIIGRPIDRTECSLPGYAALKLPLYFLRAALFNRISAAARDQPCDDEQDRRAFHLLILESEGGIARPLASLNGGRDEAWKRYISGCRFNALTFQLFNARHD